MITFEEVLSAAELAALRCSPYGLATHRFPAFSEAPELAYYLLMECCSVRPVAAAPMAVRLALVVSVVRVVTCRSPPSDRSRRSRTRRNERRSSSQSSSQSSSRTNPLEAVVVVPSDCTAARGRCPDGTRPRTMWMARRMAGWAPAPSVAPCETSLSMIPAHFRCYNCWPSSRSDLGER